MYYYKFNDKFFLSNDQYLEFKEVTENEIKNYNEVIYLLTKLPKGEARRSYAVTSPAHLFIQKEDLSILKNNLTYDEKNIPQWLVHKISSGKVTCINTEYYSWMDVVTDTNPKKFKINIIGLGDVGGTMAIGLRLLGGNHISEIGIYDRDLDKVKRWNYELGQILSPSEEDTYPKITPLKEDELFNCDVFVFCVSIGVPKIGNEQKDVRLVQLKGNAKIVGQYAKAGRKAGFKGLFAVVSDPVDLLCKEAFIASNKNSHNELDYLGLAPEQIKGYGLGVMNARAAFYAEQNSKCPNYIKEGRAFGPHGEGLIVANSLSNYDESLSDYLTEKAKSANLEVRSVGFKPFIAPALSSGALSILATIKGQWHYSSNFIGGTFMGSKNRITESGLQLETYDFPPSLYDKLCNTYKYLSSIV